MACSKVVLRNEAKKSIVEIGQASYKAHIDFFWFMNFNLIALAT